jgi:hypothetical protein
MQPDTTTQVATSKGPTPNSIDEKIRETIASEWGESENNRRAKYYTLTAAGRKRLKEETASSNGLATAKEG